MTIPVYTTLISDFLNKMDDMTQSFLADNYQALANYMAVPLTLMGVLLIVITGYLILMGKTTLSGESFLKMALTVGGVNLFALNWLYFSDYFVALFLKAASEISSIGSTYFFQFAHLVSTGSGINDALQTVLTESVDVGVKIMGHGGYTNWMPLLIGLIYMVGGTLIVALGIIEVSMIKFFICLLLSTAPLFIALYLFEQTRAAYTTWLGLVSGFSFALIFSGMTIGMAMNWMHWVVGGIHQNEEFDLKIYTIVPLIVVVILSLIIFYAVIPLAKNIGGAVGGGSHTGDVLDAHKKAGKGVSQAASKGHSLYKNWKNK